MKNKPSESTERLIESLYTKKGLWDRFVQPASQDEVIRHIAAAGEPAVIPDLLPILITGEQKVDPSQCGGHSSPAETTQAC